MAQGFEAIYHEYSLYVRRTLYWVGGPEVLDDLVQETFVRVWKALPKFKQQSTMKTWIYRIAMNVAYDSLRKKKDIYKGVEPKKSSNDFESLEMSQVIDRCILAIPLKRRSVFVLHYKMELSVEETAEALKVSQGTIKSRLHKARQEFKNNLKAHGVDYGQ